MATPSLILGSGNWAVKSDSLLGYALPQGKYVPREFIVTRATTATRVNETGLVQLVPYNLFSSSEMFSDANWAKTFTSITPNTTTAPNGTLTADTLSVGVDVSSVRHRLSSNSFNTQVTGTTYTATYYLKENQNKWIQIVGVVGYTTNVFANFNLATGTIGNVGTETTASIENVGNGWYRCRVSGVATGTSTTGFELVTTNNTNSARYPPYQSLVAEDVCYVWGAQEVEGTDPLTYLPTTTRLNIPRIDYSTGSSALLLEPQRTNLATYSQEIDNVVWAKGTGCSVISNSSISPSGVQNADTIVGATGPFVFGGPNTLTRGISGLISSTSYVFTAYLKGSGAVTLTCRDGGTGLTNSVVCNLTSSWQRFEISRTTAVASTALAYIFSNASGNFDLWGAQLELGAYPTSYIPTTSATVTRNADVVNKTGISSLINSVEGSFYVEANSFINEGSFRLISISDGTTNNRITIGWSTFTNTLLAFMNIGGTIRVNNNITPFAQTSNNKILFRWGGGNFNVFVNGVNRLSLTSVTMPTANLFDKLGFDLGTSSSFFEGNIKSVLVFPTQLTDTQCTQLTTL
jgi:hypothetical protein